MIGKRSLFGVILSAALILCGWGAGGCGKETLAFSLASDTLILAFGDSLTFGYGAEPDEAYPARLAALLGCEVINAGVNGETTSGGRKRLPGVLETDRPDVVILCLGGNDFIRREPVELIERNLAEMIEACRGAGAQVLLVAVPRPGVFLSPDPLYDRLAQRFSLPVERGIIADVLNTPGEKTDPIHPNAAGYRRIAETLAPYFRKS